MSDRLQLPQLNKKVSAALNLTSVIAGHGMMQFGFTEEPLKVLFFTTNAIAIAI